MFKLAGVAGALSIAFVLAAPGAGLAGPITGTLDLSGTFQPTKNGASTQNMAQSTGIEFLPASGNTGSFSASNGTGSLALFSGHSGQIEDFSFSPFSAVAGFYTMTVGSTTLSFDLSKITIVEQSSNHLDIDATGTLHLTGFADTAATFDFVGTSSNGASPHATFSWTAVVDPPSPTPSAVPEPSGLALMGLPLLGIGLLRRRKAA
jgi:hypothetical protein